jgi:hypothetical protein
VTPYPTSWRRHSLDNSATMADQPPVWGASWRNKVQAVMVISVAVIGLVIGLVALYFDRHDTAEISAYASSSACAAPADAIGSETCRYAGQATLVSTRQDTRLFAVVTFASTPGRTFSTSWPLNTEPDHSTLSPGAAIAAELWNGKITKLGGVRTVDNPQNVPSGLWELTAFFTVLGVPLLVIGWQLARKAWREEAATSPAPSAPLFARLSTSSRYAIVAAIFLVLGLPVNVFLIATARSGVELAYRVLTAVVLLAIVLYLARAAWRAKVSR